MDDFCLCEIDQDGQCPTCKKALSRVVTCFIEVFKRYMEDAGKSSDDLKSSCKKCTKKYLDSVCASLVTQTCSELPEELARVVAENFAQLVREAGVEATPLLEKAWTDLCAKNGWEP